MSGRLREFALQLGLVVLGIVLATTLAEGALRIGAPRDSFHPWPPGLVRTFDPMPGVMPGIDGAARFEINSQGLRASEPPDEVALAVLTVGGSTTECRYLDQHETWPAQLEARLARRLGSRAWVANAGRSGLNTRDHLMLLEYLPDLERFDVIVFLTGANDFLLRIAQDDAYDPHALDTDSGRLHALRRAFEILPPRLIGRFPQNTELWQRLEPPIRQLVRPVRHGDAAGEVYLTWRRHRRDAESFRSKLPDLSAAIDEYRRNLIGLVELTRRAGAEPVLLTQPHLWRAGLPPEFEALLWMGGIGEYWDHAGSSYYTPAALASGMHRYNAVAREVGRQLDVAVVDLAARLPQDTTVFHDDVHFNVGGAQAIGAAVAETVLALDRRPSRASEGPQAQNAP
jgi:lysophospholipase L1-like esterase